MNFCKLDLNLDDVNEFIFYFHTTYIQDNSPPHECCFVFCLCLLFHSVDLESHISIKYLWKRTQPVAMATCGSFNSFPAVWIRSQPRLRRSSSTAWDIPSREEGVGESFSRGRTELEMVRMTGPTAKTTGSLVQLIPPPVGHVGKLTQLFGRHTTPVLVPVQLHHRERPPQAGARPCPPLHGSRPQRQAQHREPFRRQSSGEERGQEESLCVFSTL